MGPNSLPPLDVEKRSTNIWLVAIVVFVAGLGAGVLFPAGLKYMNATETKVTDSKEPLTMPGPNGKLRRVNAPLSHEPAAEKLVEAKPVAKSKQKPAATSRTQKEGKKAVAKIEKPSAPVKEVVASKPVVNEVKVARAESAPALAPAADLIEEVPSALSAVQVDRLLQTNSALMVKNKKNIARPVALPPAQNSAPQGLAALPVLKTDPRGEGKTYPVSINNASFSKTNLGNCAKRCALIGTDAMGQPIRAIFDGTTYAAALMQHNGTINISGQPRIVKNQQVLLVENITFNLSSSQKSAAKRGRGATVAPAAGDKSSGYTEVSFEGDDLKPGTVIKNRKQIPVDDQQEIPSP